MTHTVTTSLKYLTWLTLSLWLAGCSSILKVTTDEPIRTNPGKRTLGAMIDDQQIETLVKVNLSKVDPELDKAHIGVTSHNGVVLLTGQIASPELRDLAGRTVRDIHHVRQVYNELELQGNSSFLARTSDTWLSAKLKTKLMANKDVESGRVKVVTENGVVYIMGLLTRIEADKVVDIARTTGGVQKVVKAVEYID